ncbi:hypothetical protein CCUS01_01795 [Colletotrichum cuscutae]|uniref:Glutamate decarboxylase n=1 Tax=Colletotrichum cuscutae TaxID=1209917 RepID=A0AAI9UFC5_9PEZI|nr:hypothetical protein CCUS01_01795 [Colletotrichum cuscutae]
MSNNCLNYAQDTEKAFDTWLLAVSEFHQASVQKHGTTEQESQDNLSAKLQAEIEASYTNKELEKADKASEEMKKSLAKQEKAFQAANDAVPFAWETCAMGALNAIASAGPSLVAQALPAIINAVNPMSAVNGVVGGLAQVGRQGALNAPGAPPIAQALLGGQQGAQPGGATLQFNDATPETDPAYVAAPLLAPFMTTLLTYLTAGEGRTPDWSKFKDQASKNGAGTEGLTWLLSNLQMQQRSAKLGTGAPSAELAAAFESSIAIVEDIKKEVANQQKLSSAKTDPASIKKWQDAITQAKLTVTKLEATAKSFPGSSSNAPKLNNISVDKKDNSAITAALSTATEKLALNQKALETAQANYTNAVAAAAEVQKRLTGIQTKLKGIKIAGAALERVKEILIECIAILVELKVQISKLTTFFNALSTMVKVIIETKVKNFDTDVTAIGQEASQRGILKLNDLDIETIYISTLQIKAYFDLLQMICQMYTNVHAKYVNPGLDLLTELSKVTKTAEEIASKRDKLNNFTDAANKAINELVAQEISDGLQSRIDAIAEQTDILHKVGVPMPAAGIIQAMRTGGEVIKDAVKDNLPSDSASAASFPAGLPVKGKFQSLSTTTMNGTNGTNGHHAVLQTLKRAEEVEDLLDAVKGLIVPYIRAADEAAGQKANGFTSVDIEGVPSNVLVDTQKPEALVEKLKLSLPEGDGLGKEGLLDVVQKILRYSVNTWDQGFMDKLYASNTPVGVVSDLVLSVLNTNLHVYQVSPALSIIEKITARKFANLFGFNGPRAGGVTCQGGSASNLTSLVVARSALYPETKASGNGSHDFVIFTSAHGHYSVEKSALACGLGASSVWAVPIDDAGRMIPEALRELVVRAKAEGKTPLYVNSTAGTTVMGSYDPFEEISSICKEFGLWFHIDASWGGSAIFSGKQKAKLKGSHLADSLTVNPHKMMNVPVTCSFLLTPDEKVFHKANTLPAGYLFHNVDEAEDVWDLADLTLQCGRRGDSLKLALAWIYYGAGGFEQQIDHAFSLAEHLATLVRKSDNFVLVSSNPPPCLQVCFYYAPNGQLAEEPEANTRRTSEMVHKLIQRGFMIDYAPGERGSFFRVVVNCQTLQGTVEGLVKALEEVGKEIAA